MAVWDSAVWNADEWQAPPIPPPGWGDDWSWWYQVGSTIILDLTGLLVEARWTTDSHTLGDGTFRGDIQPGTLTARFQDPERNLDNLNKLGAVWALYKPTGACWCWFYDSFARGLYAPGDTQAADCVFTGTMWPSRLTTPSADTAFPSQSVNARLTAIVSWLNGQLAGMNLPPITAQIAAQSQTVPAAVADATTGQYPSYLAFIRAAAANGVAWMSAAASPGAPGTLILNYARWETSNTRILDRSQIIAGPPTTASTDFLVTFVQWTAILGTTGAASGFWFAGPGAPTWGYQGPGAMRICGNVTLGSGPEQPACQTTAQRLSNDRSNPSEQYLNTVSLQSGSRSSPTGGPSSAAWDPLAMNFSPTDVASITDDAGAAHLYRVTKTDHRLTVTIWEAVHTLEKFTPATPLP